MNSFEQIGHAQLMAHEGQRQFARALAALFRRAALRVLETLGRHLPQGKATPW